MKRLLFFFLRLEWKEQKSKGRNRFISSSSPISTAPPALQKLSPPEEALMPVNVRRRREKSFGPSPSRPPLLDEKLYFDKKRGECRT